MPAVWVALTTIIAFVLAIKFYARWIERRVFEMDNDDPTPAHTHADGVDFVPCNKHVLFGHHFCSVAGAAPIVGPAIAVIWGWVPALLWVVIGTIFIGAVHDYGALCLSAKKGGRTMGDLAGTILGSRARIWFLLIIVLLTWVVIAVFAWLIAFLFTNQPASVWPVNIEIAIALVIGFLLYRRKTGLLWPSIIAVVLLYVAIFISAQMPEAGQLPASMQIANSPIPTWILFLLAYSYIASVLPVRILLQPRDYINSHQLFIGLAALLLGLVIVNPTITAPEFNTNVPPGTPSLLPLLFITIACGAISGFHGLVASGTTSKQLNCMRDARAIGYGGMLGEGLLAMIAVLAVTAGLGDAWHSHYDTWEKAQRGGIGNFVLGASTFISPLVEPFVGAASAPPLAKTVVAVIVISFAATTLDTAARIQRFCLSELAVPLKIGVLKNRFVAAAVAIVPAGILALGVRAPGRGMGSGGFLLWPIFGTTNQLIGGITLLTLWIYLRRKKRPSLPIALPMMFLIFMTTWAACLRLAEEWRKAQPDWVVFGFGSLFLLLEVLIIAESVRVILRDSLHRTPKGRGAA